MNQALSFPWYTEGSQGSYKCSVDLTLELYVLREGPEEFLDHGWALLLGPNLAAPLGRYGHPACVPGSQSICANLADPFYYPSSLPPSLLWNWNWAPQVSLTRAKT